MARTTTHQPSSDAKASAAAMDALNLDDLFLGNDDQSDSLFADMDIDLGDMDGIIGEAAEGGMAAGDVMSEEFGGLMKQQQQQQEQQLDVEAVGVATSTTAVDANKVGGSPSSKKRTRRRSRKMEDSEEQALQLEKQRSSSSGAGGKAKTRRGGSRPPPLDATAASSQPSSGGLPTIATNATQQQNSGVALTPSSMDFLPQKTKRGILPTRKNQQAIKDHTRSGSFASSSAVSQQSQSNSNNSLPSQQGHSATLHPHVVVQDAQFAYSQQQQPTQQQKKMTLQQRSQELVSNYGIKPSRTQFFPYMHLPSEVEVKKSQELKKGQKAFPFLDKLNHLSVPDSHDDKDKNLDKEKDSNIDVEKLVPTSSPIYTLFNQHLGALIDNHGNQHTPQSLQKSLHKSTQLASSHLKTHRQPFLDELSKLLTSCVKQAAFLRQNLWNMEEWAEDHFTKEDFESSFPARRRDIEKMIMREKGIIPPGSNNHAIGGGRHNNNAGSGSIHYFPTSVVATDAQALPSPQTMPNAPTHGGPNLTPVISVKVKVKCPGWKPNGAFREKFMQSALEARLWSPVGWKVAVQRANVALAEAVAAATAAAAKAEAAACSPAVVEAVASETLKPYQPLETKSSTPTPSSPSKSRKRKLKQSTSSVSGSSVTAKTPFGETPAKKAAAPSSASHLAPHIPHHTAYHPSILTPTTLKHMEKDNFLIYNQQPHIIHFLHTKLLHPSTTPTERRAILANEISLTLQRMENARLSHQWTRARQMQKELKELQAVYEEDIDTVPETCNTIGMWRWMERTNFHDKLDEEDVYSGLEGCWQPELDQPQCLDHAGCWGSFLPPVKVSSEDSSGSGSKMNGKVGSKKEGCVEDNINQQSSLLFDRLQSLLVEVDGSSEEDDDEDEDAFLASLPSYSPEEFIHGPTEEPTEPDDKLLDVSALSLDQRTYLQLRAARLIDTSTPPENPPCVLETSSSPRSSSPKPHGLDDESIDTVLQKMKTHLSSLHVEANSSVAALQRTALTYASHSADRRQKERDDDAILAKYRQLQNTQKEQKEEKRRISGRIKTGSHKMDGEIWLPW